MSAAVFDDMPYVKAVRYLRAENARRPDRLTPVPRDQWRASAGDPTSDRRCAVFVSKDYLVQVFREDGGVMRLSINRTMIGRDGNWLADLSWDELQAIKDDIGYSDCTAVEVFPPERDIVNVANMRHLWVLPEPLPFAWRRPEASHP